jgi:DNA-binding LacI/PurR family transcriptional regulator
MALPVVAELAQRMASRIEDGSLQAGQRLPAVRSLAQAYGVSLNSIQSALRHLEGRGLIESRPRRGNFVTSSAASISTSARQIGFVRYYTPGKSGGRPEVLAERDAWGQYILQGVEEVLIEADHNLTLLSSMGQKDWAPRMLERLNQMQSQLAGVVLYATPGIEPILQELDRRNLPWITINRYAFDQTHNFVCMDYLDAGLCVGRLLEAVGRRRVAVLGVDMAHSISSKERVLGLLQARLTAGQGLEEVHLLDCEDWFEVSAWRAMNQFLGANPPPEAIFAAGDFLCFGAIRACQEHGLRVPEDVAVIGSSGLGLSRFSQPTLSLVQQPMSQIGQVAAQSLLRMIRQGQMRQPGQFLPGHLLLRGSTLVTSEQAAAAATQRTAVHFDSPADP